MNATLTTLKPTFGQILERKGSTHSDCGSEISSAVSSAFYLSTSENTSK